MGIPSHHVQSAGGFLGLGQVSWLLVLEIGLGRYCCKKCNDFSVANILGKVAHGYT